MKLYAYLAPFFLVAAVAHAQDVKSQNTKFDQFSSKTGTTIKVVDFYAPEIELRYGSLENKVSKVISGGEAKWFFVLKKWSTTYKTYKIAAVAYEDLLEIIKALDKLKSETASDISSKPDNLENRFVTVDGLEVGYYIDGKKARWFIVLEKYGRDSIAKFKDVDSLDSAFARAKKQIEELK